MSMTFTQYLLSKIAEECGEVAKEALKGQQQGIDSTHRGKTNLEYIRQELLDLIAVVAMFEMQPQVQNLLQQQNATLLLGRVADPMREARIDKRCFYAVLAERNGNVHFTDSERDFITKRSNIYVQCNPEVAERYSMA